MSFLFIRNYFQYLFFYFSNSVSYKYFSNEFLYIEVKYTFFYVDLVKYDYKKCGKMQTKTF